MDKLNSSYWIIAGISLATIVASWTGMLPAGLENLPIAMAAAVLILHFMGKFKEPVDDFDELSDEQKDFVKKMTEEVENMEIPEESVVINLLDADGKESKIILHADGTFETEGEPEAKMLEAIKSLSGPIKEFGPAIIAAELIKEMEKRRNEK